MAKQRPKKWASQVNVKQGALKRLGYPSFAKLKASLLAGKVSYKTLMSRLNFCANMGVSTCKRLRAAFKAWRARKKGK